MIIFFSFQQLLKFCTQRLPILGLSLGFFCLLHCEENVIPKTNSSDLSSTNIHSTLSSSPQSKIEVHNRILWSYRHSIITVLDVVKKLDQFWFHETQSQKVSSQDQFIFYTQNWRAALQDLIDSELIYQDAQDYQITLSDAEAKEELVRLFGNDYLTRLDTLGYSLSEAIASAKKDLLTQRMLYFKILAPSMDAVTPQALAHSYEEMVKNSPETDLWTYQIINVQGLPEPTEITANQLHMSLKSLEAEHREETISNKVIQAQKNSDQVKISLSKELKQISQQMSQTYLKPLQQLQVGQFSIPILFSQNPTKAIYRIFHLIGKEHRESVNFLQAQKLLEDSIKQRSMLNERQKYTQKLRKQLEAEQGFSLHSVFNQSLPLFTLQ
jgi:hypothetical protein